MLASARKLASAGADFLICPDNTDSPGVAIRRTSISAPVASHCGSRGESAAERGFRRLGLTGTRWLVDSEVYPEKLAARGLECIRPNPDEREQMNRIIMDELVYGITTPKGVSYFLAVIQRLKERNCDAVILGCTEIPLIVNDENSVLPTLDSTRLLARAALRRASQTTIATRA